MARGSLRIYLGASPGVGKTYRMLGEGVRRHDRGTDVVVGLVETHGRAQTIGQIRDLEVIPRRQVTHRGATFAELDVDAIIARNPRVVLVDEYAHTNAPGSRNEKRWQDIEQLLDAGIDVISTLNIQHLESLNDVITRITGIEQRETVPDDMVRRADQLELVDMTPEAIRRRLAHGNIYPADRIDAALGNYFRPGNLGALRELALLWVADRVEESLNTYLSDNGISAAWETRERVVVGLTGYAGGEHVIRRAARMAGRVSGELIAVHVAVDDGLAHEDDDALTAQRRLVGELGGTVHEVVGHDPAETLIGFAMRMKATQLVIGATRRSRWHEMVHGSFVARLTRLAGEIDVHVIAHDGSTGDERRALDPPPALDKRRRAAAWLLTIVGLPLLIALTVPFRRHIAISTELLLALALVLLIAAIGGRAVAACSAVIASLLVNYFLVPPFHTFDIAKLENAIALVVFLAVAVTVGSLVDNAARRSTEARRARLEAEALTRSTASLAAEPQPLPSLLEQVRETFDVVGVRLGGSLRGDPPIVVGDVSGSPQATVDLTTPTAARLEVFGRPLSADDHRLLRILGDQLGIAIEKQRLATEVAEASMLADVDAVRTALLRAVSHDLRTPLASIKAMISGLRDTSVAWTPEQTNEALTTVEEETDRLNRLVGNLLDASRLQIGALAVDLRAVGISDVIGAAVQSVNAPDDAVDVYVADGPTAVRCDPALLERAVANLLSNALRFSPPGAKVRVDASAVGDAMHLRIIDRGRGIAPGERTLVLAPFQRLGDQHSADGAGLGLAIAQGFVDAMDGTMTFDDTPGGGLTVTITLPLAGPLTVDAVMPDDVSGVRS